MSQPFSNAKPPKQWVNPISTSLPKVADIALNEALHSFLVSVGTFESAEMGRERERVLAYLAELTKKWGKTLWEKNGLPDSEMHDSSPKLHTFGSYRLGVHDPNADIDCLCILPHHIEREDFFSSLYDIIRNEKDITNITPIANAKVPVMQMEICGISIDLTCARLQQAVIPSNLGLSHPKILIMCVDATDRLSLNGPRVTDEILTLVPSIENFRMTLRSIKRWAKARAIYSNSVGFPGGVSWAMLTAQICQYFPNALPATLLCKFFKIYTQWPWPNPILLTEIQIGGQFGTEVWGQRGGDKQALMPVITPTYPAFNSTYNISLSTKAVLLKEFTRGYMITSGIEKGTHKWSDLFETLPFFSSFSIYIRINCTAPTKEEHLKLSGLVESRIRFMINKLDSTEGVSYAHPFTNSIHFVDEKDPTSQNCAYFLGLCYKEGVKQITITPAVNFFKSKVEELKSAEAEISVEVVAKSKLPDFVFPGGVRPPVPTKKKRKVVPQATENSPNKVAKTDEKDTPSSVLALANVSTPEVQELLPMELSQPSSALSINSSITPRTENTTS